MDAVPPHPAASLQEGQGAPLILRPAAGRLWEPPQGQPPGPGAGLQGGLQGPKWKGQPSHLHRVGDSQAGAPRAHDLPIHTRLPTSTLPGTGPSTQAWHWPQR